MGLKEQQDILARLYTDPAFADEFFSDPISAAREHSLSKDEADSIAASAGEEIRLFAGSLIAKRLREVEKLLPFSRKILGEGFVDLFGRHAALFNPASVKKHLEDAIEFSEFANKDASTDRLAQDVIAFEIAKLKHFATGRRLTVCSLRHDIRPILDGRAAHLARKRRTLAIWLRIKEKQRFFFI